MVNQMITRYLFVLLLGGLTVFAQDTFFVEYTTRELDYGASHVTLVGCLPAIPDCNTPRKTVTHISKHQSRDGAATFIKSLNPEIQTFVAMWSAVPLNINVKVVDTPPDPIPPKKRYEVGVGVFSGVGTRTGNTLTIQGCQNCQTSTDLVVIPKK